jgi:hypothetical protein
MGMSGREARQSERDAFENPSTRLPYKANRDNFGPR